MNQNKWKGLMLLLEAYPTSKKSHKKKCGKVIAEPSELIRIKRTG